VSLLRAEGLSKEFGGVRAIEALDFEIQPGTVFSIIGPNGAGKTTLLNLLTGIYRPSAGRMWLEGRPLAGHAPHLFAAAGIGRTFQNLQIFFNMSALENVMAGRHLHERCGLAAALLRTPRLARAERACSDRAAELLAFVGLAAYERSAAEAMPYGALKRLEIARALAAEPRLLLLDEPAAGRIEFCGEDVTAAPPEARVRRGMVQVPEGRQVFGPLSVVDNLRLGAYRRGRAESVASLERVYAMFPDLAERRAQPAGTLSGGQQQMLAMGRALMARPRLLLLDEPSMGLAPRLVAGIFACIQALRDADLALLLVEQNARSALAIADRGYVLETGSIVLAGTGAELLADEGVRTAYLGL